MPAWQLLILAASALLSAALTLLVRRLVLKTRLGLSEPRERDIHTHPVPRLGGVAVSVTFLVVCLAVYAWRQESLTFSPDQIFGFDKNLFGILGGVLLLLLVGIADDIYGLKPATKLGYHLLAGVMLAASDVLVTHITNPFGGHLILGAATHLFVVLWVVTMINVINFLDGLDGLASGVSLIATIVLYLLATKPDVSQSAMAVLAVILSGALLGFLPFNFFPAKIFLGDSGSQVLGFLLATFAIISGGKLATAFLVLGVPILDVIWVIARRIATKQPIYKADRFHLHHRLIQAGLNQKEAAILLYSVSAIFGIIALQTQSFGKFVAALILIAIMILGGSGLVLFTAWRSHKIKA